MIPFGKARLRDGLKEGDSIKASEERCSLMGMWGPPKGCKRKYIKKHPFYTVIIIGEERET